MNKSLENKNRMIIICVDTQRSGNIENEDKIEEEEDKKWECVLTTAM